MRSLLAGLVVLFFTLNSARAQQCAPYEALARSVAANGFEQVVSAKDSDGDRVLIFINPKTMDWIAVFVPQSAPVACLISQGTDFKVTLTGGI